MAKTAKAKTKTAADFKIQAHHDTEPGTENLGHAFLHCSKCLDEWKADVPEAVGKSPKEYARQQVSLTREGIQVWCTRHEINIDHIVFKIAERD